jgi:hypothetical protein
MVGVKAPWPQLPNVPQPSKDGPDVGHAVFVHQLDGDPYRVVYQLRLGLPVGQASESPLLKDSLVGLSLTSHPKKAVSASRGATCP